jgi:F-type H+-transporting ATPase subunit epsilon
MPHTKFPVEVLTPEGEVFNDEVEMISTRTTVGSIGILANHEPLLATLEPTELRLYKSDSEILRFAQGEGYLQVADNRAMLLLQEAIDPSTLDAAQLRDELSEAERAYDGAGDDSEARRQAGRDVRRLQAFLRIVSGD